MWKFVTVEDGMRNVCAAKKEMIYAVGHYICNSLMLRYEFQNIKLSICNTYQINMLNVYLHLV